MSRIPGPLARRLDRLAGRAHLFHRFAHHPLCPAYEREVFRWRRVRVCRGCALAAVGGGMGMAGGLAVAPIPWKIAAGLALGLLLWGVAVFQTSWLRSTGKLGTRWLPSMLGAFLCVQGTRSGQARGILLSAGIALGFGLAAWAYRRRGPWRGPCAECPELNARPCTGFHLQFRRERAFQRLTGRILLASALGDPSRLDKMDPTSK